MLLQQKANIHAEDDMGWSTLISAINIGHYNLTQLLLKKKVLNLFCYTICMLEQ